jgi:asparagine synthase (glutamine-hydrolysing)
MSGICGICEVGRDFGIELLAPMLGGLVLSSEAERRSLMASSTTLGVLKRWEFQEVASLAGIKVAADADLLDVSLLQQSLSLPQTGSSSNAALIAHAYAKWGLDFLAQLHGAFSLALWDEKEQRLVLAIDRLGIRSLFWRKEGERLLFASRLGAIRAAQADSTSVNQKALLNYLLFAAVPAPLSIDAGTEKLCPGTFLTFESGRIQERHYWDVEYPESESKSESEWASELREGMRSAVHRHLRDREPANTGCFLSGGTDSSSVVAFSSEKQKPTQSFSIAFEETGFSEIEYARMTARHFGTKHHERFLNPLDAVNAVEKIIGLYDEPFANSSAIGSYYCAVMAKENGVDTLLAGDGGDELFGGNERYATDKRFALYHSLPGWLRRGAIEPLVGLLPNTESKWSLPRRYIRRANIPNPRRILSYGFFLSMPPEEIFEDDFLQQLGPANWLAIPEGHFHRAKATSELNRILYLDVKMTLADNDIRKVSGTAELAGVNVRYPLLDDRLTELSGRIPAFLKLKGFKKRYLFKKAMQGILPEQILHKKKHGFGVPLAQWLLQEPRMREMLLDLMHDQRTRTRGYFRAGFFERLLALHAKQPNFYGEIVWYILALELWQRRHLERRPEAMHVS